MKSYQSLTTWDCEPEPGAPSRAGDRVQETETSRSLRGQLLAECWRAVGRRFGLSGVGQAFVSLGTCRFGVHMGLLDQAPCSVSAQGPSWAPRHRPSQPAPSDNSQGSSEYWLMLVKHLKIKYAVCEQAFCFSCIGDRGDERGISILREKC